MDKAYPVVGPMNSGLANDVATAPGDLPSADVEARAVLRSTQFRHDNTISPTAPGAGEPVLVEATTGELVPLARAAVFYTTDGSLPNVGASSVLMEPAIVEWDPFAGFLTYWRAELPPQPAGTVVRYPVGG